MRDIDAFNEKLNCLFVFQDKKKEDEKQTFISSIIGLVSSYRKWHLFDFQSGFRILG